MNDDPMFYYTRQYDEIDLFIIIKHAVCEPTSIFYYKQININDTIINELYMNNYN